MEDTNPAFVLTLRIQYEDYLEFNQSLSEGAAQKSRRKLTVLGALEAVFGVVLLLLYFWTDRFGLPPYLLMGVILLLFAAVSAMYIPSVLNTLVYSYSYSAAAMLMPVYGAYIFRKKEFCTNEGILASMVGGIVVCIIFQVIGTSIPFVAYGLAASIVLFFAVGFATRKPVPDHVN